MALISDIRSSLMPCIAASDEGLEADLLRDGPTFRDGVEAPIRRRRIGTPPDDLRLVDDMSSLVFSFASPLPSSGTTVTVDLFRSVRTSDHVQAVARLSVVLVFSLAAGLVFRLGTSVVLELLCFEGLTSATSSLGESATRVRPARDVVVIRLLKELLRGEGEVDIATRTFCETAFNETVSPQIHRQKTTDTTAGTSYGFFCTQRPTTPTRRERLPS